MNNFNFFTSKDRDAIINLRRGESKFGEHIQFTTDLSSIYDGIKDLDVDFVIFGISEDIGVYANYGKAGTRKTWEVFIKSLLNIQSNKFTIAKRVAVLGHLAYPNLQYIIEKPQIKKHIQTARTYVEAIDNDVTHIVSSIIKAGKTPIVIGGGHNNSYGNLKGVALALNQKINVVNFDAHTDFRPEEGRHSGNGFSYAYAEGFLKNYFIFGLHENYTSEKLLKTIKKIKHLKYNTYEAMAVRQEKSFIEALNTARNHISQKPFGIELDCDAIAQISSSAMTPSGFSVLQARQFVHDMASHDNAIYLHICESIPKKKSAHQIGKFITFLVTDFIRARGNGIS